MKPNTNPARIRQILTCIAVALSCLTAFADKNEEKQREYAWTVLQEIWSTPLPDFQNPPAVPEKYEDAPAVILASHDNVNASKKTAASLMMVGLIPTPYPVAKMELDQYFRQLILIQNDLAAENYSLYGTNLKDGKGFALADFQNETKHVLGARVIKSYGDTIDYSLSNLFILNDTVNGQAVPRQIIQIPDLRAGDILDIVHFTHNTLKNIQPDGFKFRFRHEEPALTQSVRCKIDDDLTAVYRNLNGAPEFTISQADDKSSILEARYDKPVDPAPTLLYIRDAQIPQIRLQVFNRRFENKPPKVFAKDGIVFANPDASQTVLPDRIEWLEDEINTKYKRNMAKWQANGLFGILDMKVHKAVKNKVKSGEWTEKQAADYLFNLILLGYYGTDAAYSPNKAALAFNWACSDAGIKGVRPYLTLDKADGPVDRIVGWTDFRIGMYLPDYDRHYIFSPSGLSNPGEVPPEYHGQDFFMIPKKGTPKEELAAVKLAGKLPVTTADDNRYEVAMKVEFDSIRAVVTRSATAIGTTRNFLMAVPSKKSKLDAFADVLEIDGRKPRLKLTDSEMTDEQRELLEQSYFNNKELNLEAIRNEIEYMHGLEVKEITDYKIISSGIGNDPGQPITYTANFTTDDLYTDGGSYMIFNLGKLFEALPPFPKELAERNPSDNLMNNNPINYVFTANVAVPDGYKPVEETVNRLNRKVENELGCVSVEARYVDGKIRLRCINRTDFYNATGDKWPQMVELLKAGSEAAQTVLYLDKE